jgi:hypothetical protein
VLVLVLLAAAPARAADPGRWRETGRNDLPITYYQGVTHDPAGSWYFDGIDTGLWRTDRAFTQTGGNPNAFPAAVSATENYNHIGDLTYDRAEGGRLLLPVECYYPPAGNTCKTGSFGVADPATLEWRYYVKLDPAEIPKAMWAEVSPDRRLVWTSAGNDLLAYRTADVNSKNAAPVAKPIKAVRRIKGGVPPSGITGAAFYGGRLFVAGGDGDRFQVWSIDLSNGSRRLEIERTVVGESEGLDTFSAGGGVLHWLIQPYNMQGPPTYGTDHATLLHFVPAALPRGGGGGGGGKKAARRRLRLRIKPRHVRAGKRVRFRATVRTRSGRRVKGAVVTLAGYRARTGRRGRATLRFRMRSPGVYRARATRRGFRHAKAMVRALGRTAGARKGAVTPPPAA